MSKWSEFSDAGTFNGSEKLPVLKDGQNVMVDISKLSGDISSLKEDFTYSGEFYYDTARYSRYFTYSEDIGGVEEAAEVTLDGYEQSCLEIKHSIIESPETGYKRSLLRGHLLRLPRTTNDYHYYETRFRILKNSDNPECTLYIGFNPLSAVDNIDGTDVNRAIFKIIIPSIASGSDVLSSNITTIVNVRDYDGVVWSDIVDQQIDTPETLFVEVSPLVDSLFTKLGIKLYRTKIEFYINDVLTYSFDNDGAPLLTNESMSIYRPMFGISSYAGDYTGGGGLTFYIDYISVKSFISK